MGMPLASVPQPGLLPGAGISEVPSSYWYYLSNQGFFWGIFRDINPIATRQAWGWEFRGFLAWSFALVFCLYIEAQSES